MKDERKSKKELIDELQLLRQRVNDLEATGFAHAQAEDQQRKLSHELGERVKELNCLLAISRLRDKPVISWDVVLQQIVELIPPAWQYPEITCARLICQDKEYKTDNFRDTSWKQESKILVKDYHFATLEVHYLEERGQSDEGPFLKEERNLIDAIAERIQKIFILEQAEKQTRIQEQKLIQLDKMAALGTLVLGVAHEINNPNNSILLNATTLLDAWKSIIPVIDEYHRENPDLLVGGIEYLHMRDNIPLLFSGILEGSKWIKNIVESLKNFARAESPGLIQAIDLNEVVKSSLMRLENLIKKSTRSFSVKYGANLPGTMGNFQQLEQVIMNLIQNACESLQNEQNGIFLSTSYDESTHSIAVVVQDEGIGISSDNLPFIQDPFFTTKRDSGGTGLGLSVSAGIVNAHDGALSFSSTPRKGTTAILTLPIIDAGNNMIEVIK